MLFFYLYLCTIFYYFYFYLFMSGENFYELRNLLYFFSFNIYFFFNVIYS